MKIDFDLQDLLPVIRQGIQQALEEILGIVVSPYVA